MEASKKDRWDELTRKFDNEFRETVALHNEYEVLREKLTNAGGEQAIETSSVASDVASQMKSIEETFAVIWGPHQEVVGACPACGGVRMPATATEGFGFGCLKCLNFEVFGTERGDPLLN
jgi:hypothetical protein